MQQPDNYCYFHKKVHPSDHLCQHQAAKYLGISLQLLVIWLKNPNKRALLNPRRLHYRLTLFRQHDLDNYIEAQSAEALTEKVGRIRTISRKARAGNAKKTTVSHANSRKVSEG